MRITRRYQQDGQRRRRAAAAVEMAFIAPIFFTLIVGIIEFGRMLMVQQVVTNASREGVRRAVIETATQTDVQNIVDAYMTNASITGASMTLSPTDLTTVNAGDPVTVTVSIPYNSVTWFPTTWFGLDTVNVEASSIMRAERYDP